jgi:hypothetical protein
LFGEKINAGRDNRPCRSFASWIPSQFSFA